MKSLRTFLISLLVAWVLSLQVAPAFWHGVANALLGYRQLLVSDTVINVNSSIGTNNSGCTSIPQSTACATAQYAWNNFSSLYDGGGHNLTINLKGAGPYTLDAEQGFIGFSVVSLIGDGSSA